MIIKVAILCTVRCLNTELKWYVVELTHQENTSGGPSNVYYCMGMFSLYNRFSEGGKPVAHSLNVGCSIPDLNLARWNFLISLAFV